MSNCVFQHCNEGRLSRLDGRACPHAIRIRKFINGNVQWQLWEAPVGNPANPCALCLNSNGLHETLQRAEPGARLRPGEIEAYLY